MFLLLRSMLILTIFLIGISAKPVSAKDLQNLSAISKFLQVHYDSLSKNNVSTIYASANPLCPSIYRWYGVGENSGDAHAKWANDVSRQMQSAGFSQKSIRECVSNSGFVIKDLVVTSHPKNKSYKGFVFPAVLVWKTGPDSIARSMPVLVQTHNYTGSNSYSIYNEGFKSICTFKVSQLSFDGKCGEFGEMKGRLIKNGSRWVIRWENDKVKAAIFTQRTVGFAKSNF